MEQTIGEKIEMIEEMIGRNLSVAEYNKLQDLMYEFYLYIRRKDMEGTL